MQTGHGKQNVSDAISILNLTMVQQILKLNPVQIIIVSVNRSIFNQNLKSFSVFFRTTSFYSNILCVKVIRFKFLNTHLYKLFITGTCTNLRGKTLYSFQILVQTTLLEPKNIFKLLRYMKNANRPRQTKCFSCN